MSNIFDRTDNTAAASLAATYTVGLNNPEKASEFRKVSLADLALYCNGLSSSSAIVGTAASGATDGSVRIANPIAGSSSIAGNARGRGAADFQIYREAATEVASGIFSAVGGGGRNTASGTASGVASGYLNAASGISAFVGGGTANVASGDYSFVPGGADAVASLRGQGARSMGGFAAPGDNQEFSLIARNTTADATPVNVFLDGTALRLALASGYAWAFTASIFGVNSTGLKGAYYIRQGMIANVGGTTALVGTIQTIGSDIETDAGLNVAVSADNTNDALDIQVTGLAATAMRWVVVVHGLQLKYTT